MTDIPQIERPDLIVPDTGPLIHLAQAEALHCEAAPTANPDIGIMMQHRPGSHGS